MLSMPTPGSIAQEPIDIYIRPLLLKGSWVSRCTGGRGRLRSFFHELVVAASDSVAFRDRVSGPCFMKVRNTNATGRSFRYHYRTEAADSVAAVWQGVKRFSYTFVLDS